jgi:hypothetical protein
LREGQALKEKTEDKKMKRTIKAYVGYSERTNTHFYRTFEIVSDLPSIGDEINGWEVEGISPVSLDCEQGSDSVYDYDYYEIELIDSVGLELFPDDDPDCYHDALYYAVRKEDADDDV